MPKIDIDMHGVVETISKVVPRERDAVMAARTLASAILGTWRDLAQGELGTTSRDYVNGLSKVPEEVAPGHLVITLTGQMANMVELGWAGGDLRDTVIPNAKTKKTSKEGYDYVHVPFSHGGPGGSGENVGKPLPRALHNVAQHLAPRISSHGVKPFHAQPGGRDTRLMGGMTHVHTGSGKAKRVGKAAQKYLNEKAQPWHSSSVYAGLVRNSATYEAATQASPFSTFRTISMNPGTRSFEATESGPVERKWIHPGIKARNFGKRAIDKQTKHMQKLTEKVLQHGDK